MCARGAVSHTRGRVRMTSVCVRLTHVELAEQFEPCVSLCGSEPGRLVRLVQLEDGLLHVPLGHDAVPLVIVEGRR